MTDSCDQTKDDSGLRTSRRAWLKKTGVLTSGLTGFTYVGRGATETKDPTTIRYARNFQGSDDYITKEVPTEWYNHLQHARNIKKRVGPQLMSQAGVKTVGLQSTEESYAKYGGRTGFTLHIRFNSDELEQELPETVDGISVSTQRVTSPPEYASACDATSNNPDDVPAGTVVSQSGYIGSLLCPMEDANDTPGYMTAAHLWGDGACPSNIDGDPVYHDGDKLGEVTLWDGSEDWAWIKHTSDSPLTLDTSVWDEVDSKRVPINGYVTEDGVAELESTNKTVFQRGITTGTVDGIVAEMYMSQGWDCVDFSGEGVQVEGGGIFGDGDSGGPVYEPRIYDSTEYAYIVTMGQQKVNLCPDSQDCSFLGGSSDVCDGTRGTAFYQIYSGADGMHIHWS